MESTKEKSAHEDLIDFYNSQIKTSEMQEFEQLELDQKDTICHLYLAAVQNGMWV